MIHRRTSSITLRKILKVNALRVFRCKFFLFFIFTGIFGCSEDQSDTKIVENGQMRLVFATKPVPHLKELVHLKSLQNLLPQPSDQNLFKLELSQAEGKNLIVESQNAAEGSIKIIRNKTEQNIRINFKGLGPSGIMKATLEGVLDDDEQTVRWSIKIDNPGGQKIAIVRFPYVAAVPAIGSSDDDFIVAPAFPGAMIENPAGTWPEQHSAGWSLPGQQSAQLLSYQDRTAGIYMASMDTVGYGRTLRVTKEGNKKLILMQEYKVPEEIYKKWESPYDVVFGVTSGTWQQTADIYKKWTIQQPWCSKTLVQRNDIPDWWKKGLCIHTYYMRSNQNESGSNYPELIPHLNSLRTQIEGPVVCRLGSWEKHRAWTAGDYFPIFDADRAQAVLKQIHKDGFHPFVFLSGILYSFKYEGPDSLIIPGFERFTDSYVITKTGEPHVDFLGKRMSYSFCPIMPDTKKFFRSVIDQLHALNIDVVQLDQATSGASPACYSTKHGHLPGPGPYQSQAFRSLLYDMREYGKSLTPDFLLLNEELHDELIPCLDAFHTREYCEGFWFRSVPGTRGIPLFTYLYHEYAIAYGGEGTGVSSDKNPNMVRDHVINLVTGKMPTVGTQMDMAKAHPDQLKVVRNHMHLLQTEVQQFLMLGKMLHSLDINVPSITFKMGGKWHPNPVTERVVLTSSWQSHAGNVGHCLVNVTDEKQTVDLQLDTRNAPGWSSADIDLYRADKPDTCEHLLKGVSLPQRYVLELEPLEAMFFVIRPSR